MTDFLTIFKAHEEELQATNADFVAQVHTLMQKNALKTKQLKDNFAPAFTTSISRPSRNCGSTKKKHKVPERVMALEEQIKQLQNEKLEEETKLTKLVAEQEAKLLGMDMNETSEALEEETPILAESPVAVSDYIESCDKCGVRHSMEHRECHFCGEVHSGCCDL